MDDVQLQAEFDLEAVAAAAPLCDELRRLAVSYVEAARSPGLGMEIMCEHFFESIARDLYPGGWAGLLHYAMRKSG